MAATTTAPMVQRDTAEDIEPQLEPALLIQLLMVRDKYEKHLSLKQIEDRWGLSNNEVKEVLNSVETTLNYYGETYGVDVTSKCCRIKQSTLAAIMSKHIVQC